MGIACRLRHAAVRTGSLDAKADRVAEWNKILAA